MTAFNSQNWQTRFKTMGDTAEQAFENIYPHAHRLGLNRPNFDHSTLTQWLRHTPDYLMPNGFFEVMGISTHKNKTTLKLRVEKLDSLNKWLTLGNGYLWVWDSNQHQYWWAPIRDWEYAVWEYAEIKRFSDNNKPYYDLSTDDFPCQPTKALVQT